MKVSLRKPWRLALALALLPQAVPVRALDIVGVQNAAVDQPQIYVMLRNELNGPPLMGTDIIGDPVSAIQAFYDTGASGFVLSEQTADIFGVPRYSYPLTPPSTLVEFNDVGIGGTAKFNVSQPLYVSLAPFTLETDPNEPTSYTQTFGPVRTQIGPLGAPPSIFGGTDIVGTSAMVNKVVVMDARPTNNFFTNPFIAQMRTFVYDPGTPFNPATPENPGIPSVHRTVALSNVSFAHFTSTTPTGADPPTLTANPMIGPDPTAAPNGAADPTPGVTLTFGGKQTTGSFLLDTGAAASAISEKLAGDLNVRYRDVAPGDPPVLEIFDPSNPMALGTPVPDQFQLALGGIGGEVVVSGFYLDSLLVRTMQGDAANDNDPAHLRYVGAPVLVFDITLEDPATHEILTLDGLFAMNLLVASVFFDPSDPFNPFGAFNPTPFNWIVFDQQAGILGLDVVAIPEPGTWAMFAAGLLFLAVVARRRARQIT